MRSADHSPRRWDNETPTQGSRVTRGPITTTCGAWLLAMSIALPARAEGLGGQAELGPAPTGLAASAFLDSQPARPLLGPRGREGTAASVRPLTGVPPMSWRPRSPSERLLSEPVDVDPFPHTRRAVPLLVPDVIEVTSQRPSPARAMSGPAVGVPWRIPGYAP